jgi:hypothetical protein
MSLKNNSKNSIDKLIGLLEEKSDSKNYKDDRFWRPEQDKSGNGFAIIRFLPGVDNDTPIIPLNSHAFQGPGGWYIENCLTTIGQKDPVVELNTMLWNSGLDSDKDIARQRKIKKHWISNVFVVSDPANPQNEGKVFLFKFGAQIKDMLLNAMKPEFEQDEKINPFSMDSDGANFRIKIKRENGYITYKYSKFDSQSDLTTDSNAKDRIAKSQHALKPFNDPSSFKSYDELKTRLNEVLGGDVRGVAAAQKTAEDVADELVEKKPTLKSKKPVEQDVDDESDALSYFQKLASE